MLVLATISYADDIVLMACSEKGLEQMMRRFYGYFRKAGGRRKVIKIEVEGKKIESEKN